MIFFIDGEWNGYKGELISMALCAEDGREFYEVLEHGTPIDWVKDNVIPVLNKNPITKIEFQSRLQDFLMQFDEIEIISDWPEDIERFCNALITGPGERINTPPLRMIIERIDMESKAPHNALEDARALRDYYIN